MNRIRVGTQGKTALVLSAGGMFGAYQAGVWDVLSKHLRPDLVVGASVGSLNGWMIAGGCAGNELVQKWLDLGTLTKVQWRSPEQWFDGLLDTSALDAFIQDMVATRTPQVDFGVVLTESPGLKQVLVRYPKAGWQHIAASCAVPLFLRSHRIDGVCYRDGGLVDPLPLWAALEMGAQRIVAVNLLKRRPWYMRAMVRAMQACCSYPARDWKGVALTEISPVAELGSAHDSMYWTRGNAARWIESGRRDCEIALRTVVECGNLNQKGVSAQSRKECWSTESTV